MINSIYNSIKSSLEDLESLKIISKEKKDKILEPIIKEFKNGKYIEVVSSNIEYVKYDGQNKILHIVFNGGNEYKYLDFPEEQFEEFMNCESMGKFFHKNINKKYTFERC